MVLPESKSIIGTGGSVVTRVIGTWRKILPFGFSAISFLDGTARIFRPAETQVGFADVLKRPDVETLFPSSIILKNTDTRS